MSKLKTLLIAAAVAVSVVTTTGTAAEAAPKVTIHKIAGKTIAKNAKTTVRPKVSRGSQVTVTSKTISVKSDGETIVDREASARLKAGTYRVTTSVAFKTWKTVDGVRKYSNVRNKSRTQTLTIKVKAPKEKKNEDSGGDHPCTTTSSGTCIQGGQFCPKAKYGQSGWDANGRRYVCTGDSDHPHWMVP